MSVNLLRTVRLRVGAGSAKPGPAIGSKNTYLRFFNFIRTSSRATWLEYGGFHNNIFGRVFKLVYLIKRYYFFDKITIINKSEGILQTV